MAENASLSAMFYNASNVAERFNSADTVKIQWNAFLNKNKELLNLFDKYDRGELKDEDLSFDTSKYINNTIDKEI